MKEKIVKLDVIKIKYYFVKDTIKIIMLERVWRKGNPLALLGGTVN